MTDRQPTADEGVRPMAESEEPLDLYGHRIVPDAKRAGSVRRWRCLDCEAAAADAEQYLEVDCDAGR